MSGEIALDTSVAVRFLNGDPEVVSRVLALPEIFLSAIVAGELLFGAENSTRALKNLPRYLEFIEACVVVPIERKTAVVYAQTQQLLLMRENMNQVVTMNVQVIQMKHAVVINI